MSYGFSASTGAFYVYEDRASYEENGNWPADVKPVSEEVWQAYCGQGPAGKVRGADRKGLPCWVDAPPPTKSTLVAAAERKKRSCSTLPVKQLPLCKMPMIWRLRPKRRRRSSGSGKLTGCSSTASIRRMRQKQIGPCRLHKQNPAKQSAGFFLLLPAIIAIPDCAGHRPAVQSKMAVLDA